MTGIFFGSTTGTTESVANQIAQELGISSTDIHNVSETPVEATDKYDCLLLGSSTWGCGELQDDWYDFIKSLKNQNLNGKKVGIFGCGDGESYPDTFCDAVGLIYDELSENGCNFIGSFEPKDYTITDSLICKNGKFVGLAIDDCNESSQKVSERIHEWCNLIKKESR